MNNADAIQWMVVRDHCKVKKTSSIDKEVIVLTVILDVIAKLDDNL
jgi:hypothetical protein